MRYNQWALKGLMAERGLDATKVAALTGLARPTISYIARGVTIPKADTLGKLARALGVSVVDFYKAA